MWLFVRPIEELLEHEQIELEALRQASIMAEKLYPLVQAFFRLVRAHQGSQLDECWL
jgi:hypothetical protein